MSYSNTLYLPRRNWPCIALIQALLLCPIKYCNDKAMRSETCQAVETAEVTISILNVQAFFEPQNQLHTFNSSLQYPEDVNRFKVGLLNVHIVLQAPALVSPSHPSRIMPSRLSLTQMGGDVQNVRRLMPNSNFSMQLHLESKSSKQIPGQGLLAFCECPRMVTILSIFIEPRNTRISSHVEIFDARRGK